jgi:SAM-dependent methyltransferase
MGYGYAVPYLRSYMSEAERIFNIMPSDMGVHHWPEGQDNLACLSDHELPLETESVDRIIMMHAIEHEKVPEYCFQEMSRILKSNGRILIIVPNRMGLWARADWTPFGYGQPYSVGQISGYLNKSHFVHEATHRALFMPPFRSFLVLRTAYAMENIGRYVFPSLSGVCIIEASKHIYSGIRSGEGLRSRIRRIRSLSPKPAHAPRARDC